MTLQEPLKEREIDILQLMADGLTNREIGDRLALAAETVRWYSKQIYTKLGVSGRMQAVQQAQEMGLMASPGDAPVAEAPAAVQTPPPAPPATVPLVQYTRSADGTHIAYQVVGDGDLDILFIGGFISHLEMMWEEPEVARFVQSLASFARVILFDKRGMGLSDRTRQGPSLEDTIADATAVLDAVGAGRVAVFGVSEGGAASILFAATYPQRIAALIVYGATPRLMRFEDNTPDWALPVRYCHMLPKLIEESWGGPYAIDRFSPSRAEDSAFRDWWARLLRHGGSPGSVIAVMKVQRDIDIRDILPSVQVPALVIHRANDKIFRVGAGRYIAEHMPNAEYCELPGDDHLFFVKSDDIVAAARRFLAGMLPVPEGRTALATVLHLRAENGVASTVAPAFVEQHQGRCVGGVNGHLVAVFDGPSRAIRCADAIREQIAGAAAGLHTGECEMTGQTVYGPAVDVAAALADEAGPGEILVTQTTVDLIAGTRIPFEPRGAFTDSGQGFATMVYAVSHTA
jgi:pimeloyl-ACP methyl ester carboxylesterase/DNA-binding CsgD family transcriptional regulator